MRILKFGGSSLADAERLVAASETVARVDGPRVVVVSAVGDTTDRLVEVARWAVTGQAAAARDAAARLVADHGQLAGALVSGRRLRDVLARQEQVGETLDRLVQGAGCLGELPPAAEAQLLGAGEALSCGLMEAALRRIGVQAAWQDAADLVAGRPERWGVAPDLEATRRRCRSLHFDHGSVVVTQGFVARGPRAEPLLLGRGGSDTTATLLGAALEAEEVAILTDVEGVASADPRVVPEARCLGRLGWAEAEELATWGAAVLHAKAVAPAVEGGVPVRIAHAATPDADGTRIGGEGAPVRAVLARRGLDLVRLAGRGVGFEAHAGLVREAEAADARVVALAWADRALTALVEPPEDRAPLLEALGRLGTVDHRPDQAVISCYGAGPRGAALLGEATGGDGWFVPAAGPGVLRAAVPADAADHVVRRMHEGLFEGRTMGRRPAA
jgi:aspartokinase/homoserine dehydrogenase 1